MPIDLDELERLEREGTPGPWRIAIAKVASGEWEYQLATERGHAAGDQYSDFNLIAAARTALPVLLADLRALRARVAELEEENEQLLWARRAWCVRTPTPGCDCPGCETARERSAQADLVASYEAELEEDRQEERDRILGARVREIARQHDARLDPYGFARAVMQSMEESDD